MEILQTEDIDLEMVADLCAVGVKRKPPAPRDRLSWHVTNLIESAYLISKGENRYWEGDGVVSGIMSMGRIWESAVDCYMAGYASCRAGVYVPDIVSSKDEIAGSLDGLAVLPSVGVVVCETKLRFTLNGDIPTKHVQQMRAYCHLADTNLVLYLSGHLSSKPPTAKATMRLIRFTTQSIQENWEMLVNTKKYLIKCGCAPQGGS